MELLRRCGDALISLKADIQFSEQPVRRIEDVCLLNVKLLFRTINSVNQISIRGSPIGVKIWLSRSLFRHLQARNRQRKNEQLDCPPTLEDSHIVMKTLETDVLASRNRLRDHQEKFDNLPKETQMIHTREKAGFMRKVSPGTNTSEPSAIMMDLEEELEHTERKCEKVVYRHRAILLILRVRIGFSARRSRPREGGSSGQRAGRSERESRGTRDRGRRQN